MRPLWQSEVILVPLLHHTRCDNRGCSSSWRVRIAGGAGISKLLHGLSKLTAAASLQSIWRSAGGGGARGVKRARALKVSLGGGAPNGATGQFLLDICVFTVATRVQNGRVCCLPYCFLMSTLFKGCPLIIDVSTAQRLLTH